MEAKIKRRLGDLLVNSGKITIMQLQDALMKQKTLGKKLGELLIEDGVVTAEDIIDVLEKQTGIKRVNLDMVNIDRRALKSIPESICVKHDLIPFGFNEGKIQIAMWDPLNIFAIDDVSIACGFEVETYISLKDEIKKSIERYYSDQQVLKAAEELSKEKQSDNRYQSQQEEEDKFDDIKNAPVVKMIDYLIKNAVEARASDIHIEPFEEWIRIRYRIDGQLHEISKLTIDTLTSLITRIKILANLNIAEKRLPQDGRFVAKTANKELDLRVSTLPTVYGEKVVIRILNKDGVKLDRAELGMNKEQLALLDNIVKSPHGIILVTGPTGSGKSTTLYTVLKELNNGTKNIVTVEDPVEFTIDGVNQVSVNAKAGLTFASGLRSILRQDPDIIMIGEIRDSETAEIAIRAAITGHLVLSTIHTNDAPSTIIRLLDMGIEPFLVATSISGVISQRLVKLICPRCKTSYKASDYEKKILHCNEKYELDLYKGEGCAFCGNTGYIGRRGVYEIMEITKKHKEVISKTKDSEILRTTSIENGMQTLEMSCRDLVIKGMTTIEELINITFIRG